VKAHRDYWRDVYHIYEPEIIAAISAHPALNKACDMLGIKLVHVGVDPVTYEVDVEQIRGAIGPNTIMMYASAPNYPHGIIDNVPEMSKIAKQYSIGLHVDCCLGGFVLPFAKKAGFNLRGT
jgi:sphinganine-1-phosphate aldolase